MCYAVNKYRIRGAYLLDHSIVLSLKFKRAIIYYICETIPFGEVFRGFTFLLLRKEESNEYRENINCSTCMCCDNLQDNE